MISMNSQSNDEQNKDCVCRRVKFCYGIGQYAEGAKNSAFGMFLLFYYTAVQGLSGTLAGIALLIALCFDGITDPVMGSISDACKTVWGRRHPFLYGAALPFAACLFFVFNPPPGLGQIPLFLWLTIFAVLTRTLLTVFSVPHMAMNAELSQDYAERTSLASMRVLFSNIGYLSVSAGGFAFFFRSTAEYTNGQLNPAAYISFSLFFAIASTAAILLTALGTHSEIPKLLRGAATTEPLRIKRVFREIITTLHVRPFRIKIAAGFTWSAMFGTMIALVIFALTYFWGMTPGQVGIVITTCVASIMVGAIFARPIMSLIGEKKETYIASMVWFALWTSSTIILRLIGFFPPNGHWSILPLITITNAIAYAGHGVGSAMSASMIADITDEHERLYNVRQEGIYYGAISLMAKIASGFGTFMAGIISDLSGITKIATGSTDASAVFSFGMIWGPLPLVAAAIAIVIILKYDIDQVRHTKILEEISMRKAVATQPEAVS
jgi:GPH family glycoside/pentoside/hexuronide:cation symporter